MTNNKDKTYGVTIEDSALAFSLPGVTPGKWLQDAASTVFNAIKDGVQAALDLGNRTRRLGDFRRMAKG
jgi:hypothetical protein